MKEILELIESTRPEGNTDKVEVKEQGGIGGVWYTIDVPWCLTRDEAGFTVRQTLLDKHDCEAVGGDEYTTHLCCG